MYYVTAELSRFSSIPRRPAQYKYAPLVTPRDANVVVHVRRPQPSRGPHGAQWERHVDGRAGYGQPARVELNVDPARVRRVGSTPHVHRDEPPRPPVPAK